MCRISLADSCPLAPLRHLSLTGLQSLPNSLLLHFLCAINNVHKPVRDEVTASTLRPTACSCLEQEVQLSQRGRATLRVTEYFAKSLKVIAE